MAPGGVPRTTVTELVKAGENKDGHLSWSEIPEVRESLTYISKNGEPYQVYELKFELVCLEAAFNMRLRSLLGSPLVGRSVTDADRKLLFSSLERVLKASDDLLVDLEQCWRRDVLLAGVFDVVRRHEAGLEAHARHCANQKNAIQHLQKLKKENAEFVEDLAQWETCDENYSRLDVESVLDLPKGRITSIVLVSESALNLMDKHDPDYKSCHAAIKATRKIASKCDQAVDIFGRRTTLLSLIGQLTFGAGVAEIPIAATSRKLVMNDEVTLLTLTGGSLSRRSPRNIILFNDLILITKKVSSKDDRYTILDYCYLNNVELKSAEDLLSVMHSASLAEAHDKLLLIKLKKNHENKSVVLLFSCSLEAIRDDWTRLLVRNIANCAPQTELKDALPLPVAEAAPEPVPYVPSRTTDQMRIIEELKIKQESRKKDFLVPENVVEEFNDAIEETPALLRGKEPFLIPRPVSRHVSVVRADQPPTVPTKPVRPITLQEVRRPSAASVEATASFNKLLDYPPGMAVFPLESSVRWLVKSGEVVQRWHFEDNKYTNSKIPIHVTLFSDVLFVTTKKKTGDGRHKVRSYGMRNLVDMTPVVKLRNIQAKLTIDRPNKFVLMIHMWENHKRRAETMVVCVPSALERDTWLKVVPAYSSLPVGTPLSVGEHTYDPWDRPLVLAVQPHVPAARHELPLAVNDKLHVNMLRADGWCEGERVSDGRVGILPVSCTVEMESPHKHARELRAKPSSLIRG